MRCILKGSGDFTNPIQTIFNNRGITEELFEIGDEVVEDYNNYNNMQKGVELLLKHIRDGNEICIVVDSDQDGFSSAAIIYRYIKEVFKHENLKYTIHKEKKHGLSNDVDIPESVKLIILPDGTSSDYEQYKYYFEKNIDVLCLDHHEAATDSKYAVIINNQLSKDVLNKNLAGVGVTYKFLKALDEYMFDDRADNYLDLVALGNIADMMDLKEKETRYLCYLGMENVKNPFIKALKLDNAYDLEGKYNINKIGWTIAPKVNGMIRNGGYQDKVDLFEAFISDDDNFCLEVAKKCKSVKSSQDRQVKKELGYIEETIQINDNKFAIIQVDGLDGSYTGLVANKIQDKYGVPTLLYRVDGNKISGSGRGNENISSNFKEDLVASGLIGFAEGHPNSFGWASSIENLEKLKVYLNEIYKNKEVINGKTYEVDFIFDDNTMSIDIIEIIAEYHEEWGNGLDAPKIAFENLMIAIDDSNVKGKTSKTLVFEVNGIKFVKKFLTNELKDKVLNKGFIFVDVVGECTSNEYDGKKYAQVEICDIEIK